jgi:hypothetical protein
MQNRAFWFAGGETGEFRVLRATTLAGEPIADVPRVAQGDSPVVPPELLPRWVFRGVTSNHRYTTRAEKDVLVPQSPALGKSRAALILLKKNDAWWNLAQDERRQIFEEQSRHTTIGMRYLSGIARKLHHCRDLGTPEPFDFLTWFEFEPSDESAFDELVAALRASIEWRYIEREVDVRLARG